jgi:hypothetical protein
MFIGYRRFIDNATKISGGKESSLFFYLSLTAAYKAFSPEEAHRIANRFEWHYTPKHGSWLNMAEIEIGVMCRQALSKPLPDLASFKRQIKAWTLSRNIECSKISWQFTTSDARIKLKKLYPLII